MSSKKNDALSEVVIYTDGAAEPNPGPGGYGVVLKSGPHRKELTGGFEKTTNNRMELMAAIVGLEALKSRCSVTLYSDSEYLVKSINSGAVARWRNKGWRRSSTKPVKNIDLWKRFLDSLEQHDVELVWVRGHVGVVENERCDQLAGAAAREEIRPVDDGYTEPSTESSSHSRDHQEGEPCTKCHTPLVRRVPKKRPKPGQLYRYDWYLFCPGCNSMFLVDEAKRYLGDDQSGLLDS